MDYGIPHHNDSDAGPELSTCRNRKTACKRVRVLNNFGGDMRRCAV